MKRIVLTGGGTAGHVTPNMALIPVLKKKGYDIHYIGSHDGIEKKLIEEVNTVMFTSPLIGCTACRYCCDGCPSEINIPEVFRILNTIRLYGKEWRSSNFYRGLTEKSGKAKYCVGCGQCESVCPQHLKIIELLAEASGHLDK